MIMKRTESNSFIQNIGRLGRLDPVLFAAVLLLNGMGLVSINSVAQVAGRAWSTQKRSQNTGRSCM